MFRQASRNSDIMRFRAFVSLALLVGTATAFGCPFQKLQSFLPASQRKVGAIPPISPPKVLAIVGPSTVASPLEVWTVNRLENMYHKSGNIRCPFFRRRASDMLEGLDTMARFVLIRHKSLDLPLGCRVQTSVMNKHRNLEVDRIYSTILQDWKVSTDKGYYISGRLNSTIYREDCKFDGPDPDMPVKGLRKYLNAASQLFDYANSYAGLLSLRIENPKLVVARWKMEGVLNLPWHPTLPELTGTTYYHLDEENLIYLHEETWDVSVAEAFLRTLCPEIGDRIWNQKTMTE